MPDVVHHLGLRSDADESDKGNLSAFPGEWCSLGGRRVQTVWHCRAVEFAGEAVALLAKICTEFTKHAKATHVHSAGLGFHQLALDLQCCCGNFEWKVLWKLAVLTVSKGVGCKFGKSAWQLLQVSRKVRNWVYPRGVGRPRIVSPELQWICHVTTLLFWFCETVGWTAMGRRRQQRAAGRLRWLPSEVRCAIGDGKVHEAGIGAVCSWLGYQIASPLRRGTERSQGVVYLLSGGRASYVGVTSFRRPGSGAKCKLSGACPRYWEHIQDLRKNPNDHQAAARNKRRCFSCVDEAKIAVLELSRGDMELLRVVEKRLISSMCPDANTPAPH